MRRILSVLWILALFAASACTKEGSKAVPDARFPDDQGVVKEIDFQSLKLDGGKSYQVSEEVESISTYTKELAPILTWKNKYVHLGLDGDTVIWVSGVGVVDTTKDPPTVFYTNGLLKEIDDDRRAIFSDGTVLQLAKEVDDPPLNQRMTMEIDAKRHVVMRIRLLVAPETSPT